MTRDDFRRPADTLRSIPLEVVFTAWGAVRDPHDPARWRTERGPISVTGTKFFNWHTRQGGGGAIDLVMHLSGCDARTAMDGLARQLGSGALDKGVRSAAHTAAHKTASNAVSNATNDRSSPVSAPLSTGRRNRRALRLPPRSLRHLTRVQRYLTERRGLSADLLAPLIEAGTIYADGRGNAVFVMVAGKPPRAVGAELRGTGPRSWRGLAPGTCKDAGYFWIGVAGSRRIILCESAIDAISCYQLQARNHGQLRDCICISTAGVRPDASWLVPLLSRGYGIYCGYDTDAPGEAAAIQLTLRHPLIERLRPPAHDWNDALTSDH